MTDLPVRTPPGHLHGRDVLMIELSQLGQRIRTWCRAAATTAWSRSRDNGMSAREVARNAAM
jgi:hypothetical protein